MRTIIGQYTLTTRARLEPPAAWSPGLGRVTASRARVVHAVIALVVVAALVLRLVLVLDGASVLAEEEVPPLIPLLRPLLHLDGRAGSPTSCCTWACR
ncbi:MAG TPA: hypothetical protein VNN23_10340 [Ornithinibacter sp.]|nr:hypothetical protein [Ornithinibacter sp.]